MELSNSKRARPRRRHWFAWTTALATVVIAYSACGFPDHHFDDDEYYGRAGNAGQGGTGGGQAGAGGSTSGGSAGTRMDASSGSGGAMTGGSGGVATGGNGGVATGGASGMLDGGSDAKPTCPEGGCPLDCGALTDCYGECVSLETEAHCGACDNPCDVGEVCTNGSCMSLCTSGANCNGECVDTDTNERFCGDCNTACGTAEYCANGTCTTGCAVNQDLGSATGRPVVTGTTVGAGDDATPPCQSTDSQDVAYRWTAPADGTFTFDTLGSSLSDTILWVVDGNCGGSVLACADDTFLLRSRVEVPLVQGQVVIVYVDGYGGATGSFQLNIEQGVDGPCCAPQGTLGCAADPSVESCVCAIRSCCCGSGGGLGCTGSWNSSCTNIALNSCSACNVN